MPVAVNTASGVSALFGKTVVAIAAGYYHSLALCSDGTVAAWGHNGFGRLGDNTTTQRNVPVAVNTASGVSALFGKTVVAIAAGYHHSLALCSDGTVAAWGYNTSGQLGDNTTTQRNVPVAVNRDSGVSALFGKTVVAVSAGGPQPGAVLGRHRGRLGRQRLRPARRQHHDAAAPRAGGGKQASGVSALFGKTVVALCGGLRSQAGAVLGRHGGRLGLQQPTASSATTPRRRATCRWR